MQDTDIMGDTGVILCDCGCTIKENIDFAKIKEELIKQDHAAVVELCSQFCQQSECSRIVSSLSKKNVKRLVIGACEREIFDKALKEAVQSCNLNQGLLSCINIREHCAWVHPQKEATGKCMDGLIKAIKAIKLAKPYSDLKTMVNQDILVYGGNMAAMETGLALSRMGHNVTLVNSSESLGSSESRTPELYAYLASDAFKATSLIQKRTGALIKSIEDDHKIKVLNNSKIKSIEGELGRFTVIVESTNGEKVVSAGSIVIASDSQTPLEVEFSSLFDLKPFPARIAIVMDVEGQQGKTASAQALSAAELLAKRYKSEIKLFCNNIRVAEEGLEDLYRRARQAGTVIVKYESPPVIRENSNGGAKYLVCLKESITGREMEEEFDHVINADIPFHHNGMLPIINHLRPGPDGELQIVCGLDREKQI
jgi:heterodisulfide reductase subunit A-like polyferredoxin